MKNAQQILALALATLIAALIPAQVVRGASAAIGTVGSRGSIEVNQTTVEGSGTLFDGDRINTGKSNSTVRLAAGPRVDLAPSSVARFHSDRLELAAGVAGIRTICGYQVEASQLRIAPESAGARAVVTRLADGRVQVSVSGGSFQVINDKGMLLARVAAGRNLVFDASSNANGLMRIAGPVEMVDGSYYLLDSAASVRFLLLGEGLEKFVGKRAVVTGNLPEGTKDRVQVVKMEEDRDGAAAAASAAPAHGRSGACTVGLATSVGVAGAAAGAAGAAGATGAGAAAAGAGAAAAGAGAVSATAVVAGVGIAAGAATAGTLAYQAVSNETTISK